MFVKLFQGLKENVLVVAQRKTRSHCPRLERGKKQRWLFLQRQRNCWKVCHLTVIKFSYNLEVFNWLIFYSCKNCKTSWCITSFKKCVTLIFYWPLIDRGSVDRISLDIFTWSNFSVKRLNLRRLTKLFDQLPEKNLRILAVDWNFY